MNNLSFTNTPEGGLIVNPVEEQYLESTDKIAGLEIEGTVSDGDVIQYNGSEGTWDLVPITSAQNKVSVESGGTEERADVTTLNFTNDLDVGVTASSVEISVGSTVLRNLNTAFSIQSVSSNAQSNGNVINVVVSSGSARTLTISSSQEADGAFVIVKRKGVNDVTVATESGSTVEGSTNEIISSDGSARVYAYNSSANNWEIVASF